MPCSVAQTQATSYTWGFTVKKDRCEIPTSKKKKKFRGHVKIETLFLKNQNEYLRKTYTDAETDCKSEIQVANIGGKALRMNLGMVTNKLDQISKLKNDWNGYGAKAFSMDLIERCKAIVHALSVVPEVYPTGRQSIQFQYELEDRSYLEFEIFETKIIYLQVPQRKYTDAVSGEIPVADVEKIKEIVSNFYGQGSCT